MWITGNKLFLISAALLDFIVISSCMEPGDSRGGYTSSPDDVNPKAMMPTKVKYADDVATSSRHVNLQGRSTIVPRTGKYLRNVDTSSGRKNRKGGGKFADLDRNVMSVKMLDDSIFGGTIRPYDPDYVPAWMYSPEKSFRSLFAFILTEDHASGGILLPPDDLRWDHDPAPHGPYYARMRMNDNSCFAASGFRPFAHLLPRERPPNNSIYIKKSNGILEIASLRPKNAPPANSG